MNEGKKHPTDNLLAFPIHALESMVNDMSRMSIKARPAEKLTIAQAIGGFQKAIEILKNYEEEN